MVLTRKFSEFVNGGDLDTSDITVGLRSNTNTFFNNPWVFLPPGTTAQRPLPTLDNYYKLRVNTDLQVYEYYDPVAAMWIELSGSGTGTINPGVMNDLAYYPANGVTLSPITTANNSVLVTSAGGVPSLSTTLPSGLTLPGATITGSTAALTSGSVVAAPVAGSDLVNKTYADGLYTASVHSITGTTNQVIASSPTGDVILSLPQDIATGSSPTFSGLHLSGSTAHAILIGQAGSPINSVLLGAGQILIGTTASDPVAAAINSGQNILVANGSGTITVSFTGVLPSANGGTGVNNGSSTLTLGGSLTTSGAFASTFTMTGITNVTFPTSGTLATVGGTVSSITGTANQIAASASTGAVTLSIVSNPILPGAAGFTLPSGNTAARAGGAGTMRFNSQTSVFEATVDGVTWTTIETSATGVTSVSGTANRITSTGGTTPVIDISASYVGQSSITTLGTIGTGTWQGTVVGSTYGGTGVNNGASTITIGGSHTLSGAFTSTFTFTNTTSVTFPTSGTLATTSQLPTPAALTKTDDTNVTLTLGGTPATALLQATSLTLGWTGTLGLTRGGTAASLTASNGGIVYSTASALAILAGTATAGQMLQSGASAAPTWSTSTYPATNAINTLLYASSANVMAALATANSSVLVTSAGGVPSLSTTLPTNLAMGTPASITLTNATGLPVSGITGLGTGVATALGQNVIGSGGMVLSSGSASFTPVLVSSGGGTATYSSQTGSWVAMGGRVFFNLSIILTNHSLSAGNLTITMSGVTSSSLFASCTIFGTAMAVTATPSLVALVASGSSTITPYIFTAGGATQMTVANITTTSQFFISGNYAV